MTVGNFTPRETVGELDRYIIGQHKAKRAVAIAQGNAEMSHDLLGGGLIIAVRVFLDIVFVF